ncbi:HD domain-containing protein [archaeon]|jgi:putative nucleotidyltransferase with HDIG domain|nr:HD domain-containing protein [archaeon]MBT3450629.1 HD domain-containing protein [archaeon]MBT6868685.1 HD domain-containing protein [archaeon]MBT7193473.1 HD domain-containing protein [archaeon]MBT7381064.1 HD domain-containing protein [archaeon]
MTPDKIKLPNVEQFYYKFKLPSNLKNHIQKVTEVAVFLASKINEYKKKNKDFELYNVELVRVAAALHDIGKPLHFKYFDNVTKKEHINFEENFSERELLEHWFDLMPEFKEAEHELTGANMLKEFPEVAEIVANHTPRQILKENLNKETILVNYADKRVEGDKIVTLDKRFNCLMRRYPEHISNFKRTLIKYEEVEGKIFNEIDFQAERLEQEMNK